MSIPIQNAKDVLLTHNSGTVPDMSDALLNWFQPMTFTQIAKSVVNFQVVETKIDTAFLGVWQPAGPKNLEMKDIGQRQWSHFTLHSNINLKLFPDEIVQYRSQNYRVMGQTDYSLYGYVEYQLVQDYMDNQQLSTENGFGIITEGGDPITT